MRVGIARRQRLRIDAADHLVEHFIRESLDRHVNAASVLEVYSLVVIFISPGLIMRHLLVTHPKMRFVSSLHRDADHIEVAARMPHAVYSSVPRRIMEATVK